MGGNKQRAGIHLATYKKETHPDRNFLVDRDDHLEMMENFWNENVADILDTPSPEGTAELFKKFATSWGAVPQEGAEKSGRARMGSDI